MIKQIAYTLTSVLMATSVVVAEPMNSEPVLLTTTQMDTVTAGATSANAGAIAVSPFLAVTAATTGSVASQTPTGSGVSASGGIATGAAIGGGAVGTAANTQNNGGGIIFVNQNFTVGGLFSQTSVAVIVAVNPVFSPFYP